MLLRPRNERGGFDRHLLTRHAALWHRWSHARVRPRRLAPILMRSRHTLKLTLGGVGLLAVLVSLVFTWTRATDRPVTTEPNQAAPRSSVASPPSSSGAATPNAPSEVHAPARASGSTSTTNARSPGVPDKVYEVFESIRIHHGEPPLGYVGGRTFENRERRLPRGRYREYDVNPKMRGRDRGAERLVIEQRTGKAYYTDDHYRTFTAIN